MTAYKERIWIPPKDLERINRLLDIPCLETMTDQELIDAGANTDYFEGIFCVDFDDGSTLTYDLCSGTCNYYDNVVWTSADGQHEIVLDCSYELDDIEFEADGATYTVTVNEGVYHNMALNPKLTQKQVKLGYPKCIFCSYCALQNLLCDKDKVGHTERREGWGADVYHVNNTTCIVTGYAPFGNIRAPYDICKKYDGLAEDARFQYCKDWDMDAMNERLHRLLVEFCDEVIANKGKHQ